MDLNKVMIIGRLTRDPEIKTIPSGQTVASFSLATNRVWTDNAGQKQEAVEYHNIVAWRKLAEICGQYLRKGGKIYIEGRLQTRSWDGQDGVKRYRTEIVANNMIMLDSKNFNQQSAPAMQTTPDQIPEIQVSPDSSFESENRTNTPYSSLSEEQDASNEEVNVEEVPF